MVDDPSARGKASGGNLILHGCRCEADLQRIEICLTEIRRRECSRKIRRQPAVR
jgi:hypothetical protein